LNCRFNLIFFLGTVDATLSYRGNQSSDYESYSVSLDNGSNTEFVYIQTGKKK
jgi:hypothetical protein